jgi:PAS domain S-box-containing protein
MSPHHGAQSGLGNAIVTKRERRRILARYAFAVLITAAATAIGLYLSGPDSIPTLFVFPVAIIAATWFGGRWAGLVSVATTFFGFLLIIVRYHSNSPLDSEIIIRYIAFVTTALIVWALAALADKYTEELRSMGLRFGGVVQISEDAIISVDEQQRITLFNPGAEKIFGYSREEIMGQPLNLLMPPRFRSIHTGQVKEFMKSPDALRPMGERNTIFGLRKDGAEFPAEASISKYEAGGEKILTVRLRDVSEKEQAERGLRELGAIVASSDDAIVGENLEGTITSWNAGAEKIYGYTAAETVGRNASMLVPPDRKDEVAENVARAGTGEGFRIETTRLAKDGRLISVSLTISPIRDRTGQVVGISTSARDISERKKLEEQLRQAQKMEAIGRLAGGIAHDFNNLLSIIVGYTYVLQTSLPDDDSLRGSAQQVMHAAEKASSLTRQLLAFSRRQVMRAEVIDFNDILASMEKLLPRLIGEDVELRIVRAPNLQHVKADPSQIEQVIMNLAVNSRDAMPNGGKLTIETADVYFDAKQAAHHGIKPGNYVLLAVSDTGVGMDPQTRAHIFEPFFTTKEPGRGTGLGLATVYGIVSQSEGHIWVYSEPGQGTTFKIYFPATAAAVEPSRISQQPQPSVTGSETILLVEDEEKLRTLIEEVLSSHGYKVLVAANGEEALAISSARKGQIHLLVSDVVMPRLGGQDLANQLRRDNPELDVLFMSGYTNNSLAHSGTMPSGTWFLQKPFTPDILLRKVREVLNSRVQRIAAKRAV